MKSNAILIWFGENWHRRGTKGSGEGDNKSYMPMDAMGAHWKSKITMKQIKNNLQNLFHVKNKC